MSNVAAARAQAIEPAQRTEADRLRAFQFLNTGLLAFAGGGLAAALAYAPPGPWQILVHALEGAFVGGACDWFAVWKTYNAVEKGRDEVADGIGTWVADDLLGQHVLREKLDEALGDPELLRDAYDWLDRTLGDRARTAALLEAQWAKIEPTVVDFAVESDLSGADLAGAAGALGDAAIVAAVRRCLGSAGVELAGDPRLAAFVDQLLAAGGFWPRMLGALVDVPAMLQAQALRLRDGTPTGDDGTNAAIDGAIEIGRIGAEAYIRSWNELPRAQRREAAEALLRHVRRPVVDKVAELLHAERERLRPMRTLREYPPARRVAERIAAGIDHELSAKIGRMVAGSLKRQSREEFRENLERKTRRHLEWIRVNGMGLGFVLGGVLGLAMQLAG